MGPALWQAEQFGQVLVCRPSMGHNDATSCHLMRYVLELSAVEAVLLRHRRLKLSGTFADAMTPAV